MNSTRRRASGAISADGGLGRACSRPFATSAHGRAIALLFVALTLAAVPIATARADGDPASDVLISQTMFLPSDVGAVPAQQAQLESLLHAAARAGDPIRVAVIPSDYDLGSVTVLWRKPQTYARFLGIELSQTFKGTLLVVMPNGFGVNVPGRLATGAQRQLSTIAIRPGAHGILAATEAAVRTLASSSGVRLATPATVTADGPPVIVIALAVVAALLLCGLALIRKRVGVALRGTAAVIARVRTAFQRPRTPRLLALEISLALALCTGAALAAIEISSGGGRTAAVNKQARTEAPITWSAHRLQAPEFHLTDQNGEPVSLAAFRGKPVIVTFIDPLCRDLCPLAAHVLNQVDRDLPPARRVPIVAVSVDIYADSRADLRQDFNRWSLVPQWHWAVGTPKELAAVWNDYGIRVNVQTKRIAATNVHFVFHYEVAYVIDPDGDARKLLFWPYDTFAVERSLATVSSS